MLKIQVPEAKEKIKEQIEVLKYVISQDTNEKDKKIHEESLFTLEKALEIIEAPSPAGRKKSIEDEKIRDLRVQGMTQEHIARELNISLSTVRRALKTSK